MEEGVDVPNMPNSADSFVESPAGPSKNPEFFDTEEMVPTDQPITADPSANPGGVLQHRRPRIRHISDPPQILWR
jgi:hypothetical protein